MLLRAGTHLWTYALSPSRGENKGGVLVAQPVENLRAGALLISGGCEPVRVQAAERIRYEGEIILLNVNEESLWLAPDQRVFARQRLPMPRQLATPRFALGRRQQMRSNMTPPERALWSRLRRATTGHRFRRQHGIGPYTADLYCHEARLVVEVDGQDHAGAAAVAHDADRDRYMRSLGLEVLRFSAQEVGRHLSAVVEAIADACNKRVYGLAGMAWCKASALRPSDAVCRLADADATPLVFPPRGGKGRVGLMRGQCPDPSSTVGGSF